MNLLNKKVAVGLGLALFGTQLGIQSANADMVQEERNVPKISMTREGEIPDLPTDPDLPTENPSQPETPPTEDSGNTGGSEEETPTPPVEEPDIPIDPDFSIPDQSTDGSIDDSINGSTGDSTGETTPPTEVPDMKPSNPSTDNSTNDSTEKPVTPPSSEETNKPTLPPVNNENKPANPTPPSQNVIVKPDGSIGGVTNVGTGTSSDGSQIVPIVSNDISELTNIPTPMTPVETNTGEKIVSVVEGVAYKQTEDGGLTPVSAEVKQLPSGNVAVTGADGKTKVLPKTGMDETLLLSLAGAFILAGVGFYLYNEKKKKEKNE
ncbi:LPXTG cell wall anchor domain-containing protein [Enterococcus hirae]|nr:LPXTG cell wall anchor domain-containing protein [Enterococcus hirae]